MDDSVLNVMLRQQFFFFVQRQNHGVFFPLNLTSQQHALKLTAGIAGIYLTECFSFNLLFGQVEYTTDMPGHLALLSSLSLRRQMTKLQMPRE